MCAISSPKVDSAHPPLLADPQYLSPEKVQYLFEQADLMFKRCVALHLLMLFSPHLRVIVAKTLSCMLHLCRGMLGL